MYSLFSGYISLEVLIFIFPFGCVVNICSAYAVKLRKMFFFVPSYIFFVMISSLIPPQMAVSECISSQNSPLNHLKVTSTCLLKLCQLSKTDVYEYRFAASFGKW